jgi:hypothetical protein
MEIKKMKGITTFLATVFLLTFVNCSSTRYVNISKVEKDKYTLEYSEFKWFWLYVPIAVPFTTKNYIALCKAETNGDLTCETGESAVLGFGATK